MGWGLNSIVLHGECIFFLLIFHICFCSFIYSSIIHSFIHVFYFGGELITPKLTPRTDDSVRDGAGFGHVTQRMV